ncbi:MAG: hypothetical protein Q3962_04725 [Corynebacterium sp.]|nr:hypothetical protein [Corynebacterium sp.]
MSKKICAILGASAFLSSGLIALGAAPAHAVQISYDGYHCVMTDQFKLPDVLQSEYDAVAKAQEQFIQNLVDKGYTIMNADGTVYRGDAQAPDVKKFHFPEPSSRSYPLKSFYSFEGTPEEYKIRYQPYLDMGTDISAREQLEKEFFDSAGYIPNVDADYIAFAKKFGLSPGEFDFAVKTAGFRFPGQPSKWEQRNTDLAESFTEDLLKANLAYGKAYSEIQTDYEAQCALAAGVDLQAVENLYTLRKVNPLVSATASLPGRPIGTWWTFLKSILMIPVIPFIYFWNVLKDMYQPLSS